MPLGYDLNWAVIAIMGFLGLSSVLGMFLISFLIAPKRKSEIKDAPYECGILPDSYNWSQINIRYYVFAILFLLFDIEAVFLFPWALIFVKAVPIVFYEMILFIAILFFGLIYAWKKGVLEWQ
ncbi:MAG: NADH-quinone oxidoreductase subunit A [Chloroflexi bacterium]|nr:NADH-quinone oxidoreductase subunit A [Chloroflexota bacterium]MCH2304407.1 NADH-quinone oxidoreductase subunit A [SAR202 cluster bacterium]